MDVLAELERGTQVLKFVAKKIPTVVATITQFCTVISS